MQQVLVFINICREEYAESIGFYKDPDQQGTPPIIPNARAFWPHVMGSMQNAKLHSSASIGKAWGGPLMVRILLKNNTF